MGAGTTARARAARVLVFVLAAAAAGSAALSGCRSEPAPRDGSLSSVAAPGAEQAVALDALTAELAAIRRALRAGHVPENGCAAAALVAAPLREAPASPRTLAALAERDRLCQREVPLSALTRALARIEERGAASPLDERLDDVDCAAARRWATPLERAHAAEPAVAALLARLAALCE